MATSNVIHFPSVPTKPIWEPVDAPSLLDKEGAAGISLCSKMLLNGFWNAVVAFRKIDGAATAYELLFQPTEVAFTRTKSTVETSLTLDIICRIAGTHDSLYVAHCFWCPTDGFRYELIRSNENVLYVKTFCDDMAIPHTIWSASKDLVVVNSCNRHLDEGLRCLLDHIPAVEKMDSVIAEVVETEWSVLD